MGWGREVGYESDKIETCGDYRLDTDLITLTFNCGPQHAVVVLFRGQP